MNDKHQYDGINFDKPYTYIFRLCQQSGSRGNVIDGRNNDLGNIDPPYPRQVSIPHQSFIYDELTKKDRTIRLLQGISSIWQDEQDADNKIDAQTIESLRIRPMFNDGSLFVKVPEEINTLKFLLNNDSYAGKQIRKSQRPPLYELVNKNVKAEDELKMYDEIDKAIEKIKSIKNIKEHLDHINFMNVKTTDQFNQPLTDNEILLAYRKKAEANPRLFNRTFDSPEIKIRAMVVNWIDSGKIDLNKVRGQAHYGDTGAIITVLDITRDPVDYLTEFLLSKDGAAVKKKLMQ